MTTAVDTFPAVTPHGELEEVLEDIFFVRGSTVMPGRVPLYINCNMTVVREENALTLVGSLRLDEKGLAALDKLGTVTNIIRIAGFHGKHDPFYKHRYPEAKVWAIKGSHYIADFNNLKPDQFPEYLQPDEWMDEDTKLPISDAKLHLLHCKGNEAVLLLERHSGVLLTGDSLQNFSDTSYFSWLGAIAFRLMGFIRPMQAGLGWLKFAEPTAESIMSLLDLEFAHLIPCHGHAVIGEAREKYKPAIERAAASKM